MRRMIMGAVWGMALYLFSMVVAGAIVGRQTVESWSPIIAFSAAALAAAGSWKGWLPGTGTPIDPNENG
jgi:hypothetical protein